MKTSLWIWVQVLIMGISTIVFLGILYLAITNTDNVLKNRDEIIENRNTILQLDKTIDSLRMEIKKSSLKKE